MSLCNETYERCSCLHLKERIGELGARIEGLEAEVARLKSVNIQRIDECLSLARERDALRSQVMSLKADHDALMEKHNALHISARKDRDERDALRAHIFTNTDRSMTMDGRVFSLRGDGFICDNNFDFDAGLRVSGDFVDDEKQRYAGMIASVLNEHLALRAQVEELKSALSNASAGFELAYVAVEQGRYDEALVHCGAHQVRMLKKLQVDFVAIRKLLAAAPEAQT